MIDKIERDNFLTVVAMGECYHKNSFWCNSITEEITYKCRLCNKSSTKTFINNDFSTWKGFGKLWEWAQEQKWWADFVSEKMQTKVELQLNTYSIINPDVFADAVYEFMKERRT